MSLVSTGGILRWPGLTSAYTAAPAVANDDTLDAAGEYTSHVFQAKENMTISHVGWRVGTVVAAPTADTRIETVDASGFPSGSLWAANTNLVSGALTSNTWTLHALTASASIVKGDFFAVKVLYQSGTSLITQRTTGTRPVATNIPYKVTNTTGSAVKSVYSGSTVAYAFGNSTTTFYSMENSLPVLSISNAGFSNSVAGAKRGLRFQVPFPCRCMGFQFWNSTSIGDYNAILYDDAGTELSSSSTAFDGDKSAIAVVATPCIFDSPVTLATGTWYRVAVEPTSATSIFLSVSTLPTLDYRSAWPAGTNAHYTTFTTAGGWVDSATDQMPMIDLLIDQVDNGASGAGGISRARGQGGF